MKVTVLVDNSPHPEDSKILSEHGLSFYFEVDGYKWLIDCGASGKFLENAGMLGIDISDVDYFVLSHAHADHTGGIANFLKVNAKAKIYISSHISASSSYFSTRRGGKRDISIDFSHVDNNYKRFVFVDKNCVLTDNVSLVCNIPTINPQPKGNQTLLAGDVLDDFSHEIALVVDLPEGAVIVSSCCHRGILNTLKASGREKILAYIGGTHLLDSREGFLFETAEEVRKIAETVQKEYPGMKLITGHCTGQDAAAIFRETLQSDFKFFYSGEILDV